MEEYHVKIGQIKNKGVKYSSNPALSQKRLILMDRNVKPKKS